MAPARARLRLGPRSAGLLLTPDEFDAAVFKRGCRYELIHGVLVASPIPRRSERAANEQLGHWLRSYRDDHPKGSALDATLPEETIESHRNRRRADRAVWTGLGRLPGEGEVPTIIAEFVPKERRDAPRDYETKRDEYREIGVREYWVIDRFRRTMTVFLFADGRMETRLVAEGETYATPLLPGFELPLARLLGVADRWGK